MYTLADLVRITGAKRRTVQLWAEAGALLAEPITERAGSGIHRSFSREEAIIACAINAFALNGVPIGRLIEIAKSLRSHFFKAEHPRAIIEAAIKREFRVYLIVDAAGNVRLMGNPTTDELAEALSALNEANFILDAVLLNGCFRAFRNLEK